VRRRTCIANFPSLGALCDAFFVRRIGVAHLPLGGVVWVRPSMVPVDSEAREAVRTRVEADGLAFEVVAGLSPGAVELRRYE
jgi:hypothetical protein